MESKSDIKKVGRPKKDGVFGVYRRVNEEELKDVDSLLMKIRGRCGPELAREKPVETCGFGADLPIAVSENQALRSQQFQLLKDIDILKKENMKLKGELGVYTNYST